MRTEEQMLSLILDTARLDNRIRAVVLNGSRANPNAPKDIFMDFDIIYLVTDTRPYHRNLEWIKRFGELMILQMPDDIQSKAHPVNESFCYLMQFMDGNRIDLTISPLSRSESAFDKDLSLILLDKDDLLSSSISPGEEIFHPKPPDKISYLNCCNEFWWVSTYVAKGLWRGEIIYARKMFDQVMRVELMKMLVWYIGVETDFKRNPGKSGKYMQKYLDPPLWQLLLDTYSGADIQQSWQALFKMGCLFSKTARSVGDHFQFQYPLDDDHRVTGHLHHVHRLPPDAKEIY